MQNHTQKTFNVRDAQTIVLKKQAYNKQNERKYEDPNHTSILS